MAKNKPKFDSQDPKYRRNVYVGNRMQVWERARAKAKADPRSLSEVILDLLEQWVSEKSA